MSHCHQASVFDVGSTLLWETLEPRDCAGDQVMEEADKAGRRHGY
jgi:hypothetical protein